MGQPNQRLRAARKKAGFVSARSAATRFCWRVSTYASHENGQNGLRLEMAEVYAKAFKTSAAYLMGLTDQPQQLTSIDQKVAVHPNSRALVLHSASSISGDNELPQSANEGERIDPRELGAELARPILAAMEGRTRPEVWRLMTDKITAASYQLGDYLVIDPDQIPMTGRCVLAEYNGRPIFRMYTPPYLSEMPPAPNRRGPDISQYDAQIRGVIVAKLTLG